MSAFSDSPTVREAHRQWWWSPEPFWRYLTIYGSPYSENDMWCQGWARYVELSHPGLFNLVWLTSGIEFASEAGSYMNHASAIQWAPAEAEHISVGDKGKNMADLAFELTMADFRKAIAADGLPKWRFIKPDMSLQKLLDLLDRRLRTRA